MDSFINLRTSFDNLRKKIQEHYKLSSFSTSTDDAVLKLLTNIVLLKSTLPMKYHATEPTYEVDSVTNGLILRWSFVNPVAYKTFTINNVFSISVFVFPNDKFVFEGLVDVTNGAKTCYNNRFEIPFELSWKDQIANSAGFLKNLGL